MNNNLKYLTSMASALTSIQFVDEDFTHNFGDPSEFEFDEMTNWMADAAHEGCAIRLGNGFTFTMGLAHYTHFGVSMICPHVALFGEDDRGQRKWLSEAVVVTSALTERFGVQPGIYPSAGEAAINNDLFPEDESGFMGDLIYYVAVEYEAMLPVTGTVAARALVRTRPSAFAA